jgi:hypothetical protein
MTIGPDTLLVALALMSALTFPQSGLPRMGSADIASEWSRAEKKVSSREQTGEDA